MTALETVTVSAILRSPTADDLRRSFPEIGEHLQSAFHELAMDPTAAGAEELAIELGGAQRAVLRYRERLLSEGGGNE